MKPLLPLATLLAFRLLAGGPDVDSLAKAGHWLPEAWASHSQLLHKPAPALDLSGWINGEVTPQQMKGKILVVDFWATWCGPCRRAIPHNNELARTFGSRGVLVIGACGGGREESMEQVAKAAGATYPSARTTPATTKAWAVSYWPTYAIIDRQGKVRALGVEPDAVKGILEALLAEQP